MEGNVHANQSLALRLMAGFLGLAVFLAAGVASAQPLPARMQQNPPTFYMIPGLSHDAFYLTMRQGAQAAARSLGAKFVYQGSPYAFSPDAQIPYLDAAIAQHPDAILIAPTDERALVGPIRRAVRAGIPVITVDTAITAPLAVTSIRSQNVQGGQLAADALAQSIHLRGAVASISVRPGISTTDQRVQGFAQELRRYRNIQYLGTWYDNNSVVRASAITNTLLAHYPRLAGIFAMNGLSGTGAIGALQGAHRMHQVALVEFDADPIQVEALRQGVVQALIAQDPWAIGRQAVQIAYRWVTGRRAGIKKLYYTGEAVLTRSNVDDPRLKRFLYTAG